MVNQKNKDSVEMMMMQQSNWKIRKRIQNMQTYSPCCRQKWSQRWRWRWL